jgi:hypothetical protein
MGGAQQAIEATSIAEENIHVERSWIADPPHKAVASAPLAMQAAITAAYIGADVGPIPEPEVRKWPGWIRVTFLLGAAAGAWALVIGAVVLLLHLHR